MIVTRQRGADSYSFEVEGCLYYVDTATYFNEWQGERQRIVNIFRIVNGDREELIAHADCHGDGQFTEEDAYRWLKYILDKRKEKRNAKRNSNGQDQVASRKS